LAIFHALSIFSDIHPITNLNFYLFLLIYCRFLSEFTGLDIDRVEEECDRENFLGPKEAIELGIIDGIID